MSARIRTIDDLTPGEKFWLWRKRRGMSRDSAAAHYGVTPRMVTHWEHDKRTDTPEVLLNANPSPGETAALYRRRAEGELCYIKQAARAMGISHVTLIGRENDTVGDARWDVIPWWESHYGLEEDGQA